MGRIVPTTGEIKRNIRERDMMRRLGQVGDCSIWHMKERENDEEEEEDETAKTPPED